MNRFPKIFWSIIWIIIHACSVLLMSILLLGITNDIVFIILSGIGITLVAKIVRGHTLHEPFLLNGNFAFWVGITTFSFWFVREILTFFNELSSPFYFLMMGLGIYCCSQVVQRVVLPAFHRTKYSPHPRSAPPSRQKPNYVKPRSSPPTANAPRTFLISDLHLGHRNIIRFCHRPFDSVGSMDRQLIKKWNETIGPSDRVYFLGDLSRRGTTHKNLALLHGKITFIFGNHDDYLKTAKHHEVLTYKGHSFLLVHDPTEVPKNWTGWVIHGHKHNNCMSYYPFINGTKKRINVSAELIGYRPLDIERLLQINYESIKRMDTINSKTYRMS